MLVERQLSVFMVGIGAALVIPDVVALSRHTGATPGAGLAIGGTLGALGVFLGCLLASDHPARGARILGMMLWIILGFAFAGGVFACALHCPGWGSRIVFGLVALLPLLGAIVAALRRSR